MKQLVPQRPGAIGIQAKPLAVGSAPFWNTIWDTTFDSMAVGIKLDSTAAQSPNRWRIYGTSHLAPNAANSNIGIQIARNSVTSPIVGTRIDGAYCDQLGNACIDLGPLSQGTLITGVGFESAQAGNKLFNIDAAANRTTILGYHVSAGTIGTGTLGTRAVNLGAWDDFKVGNLTNGSADLINVNQSGTNGGITVGGGSDKGVGTVNVGAGFYLFGTQGFQIQSTPSCSANCGTSPTVTGSNSIFDVVLGTAPPAASTFTITFGGLTWAAAPSCTGTRGTTGTTPTVAGIVTTTTTAVVNLSANMVASERYHITCGGNS